MWQLIDGLLVGWVAARYGQYNVHKWYSMTIHIKNIWFTDTDLNQKSILPFSVSDNHYKTGVKR